MSREELRYRYQQGRYLLALSFFLSGISGLNFSYTARQDFHRCWHVVCERVFGGTDLIPTRESLEASLVYFNSIYSLHKLLMVALSCLIVLGERLEVASQFAFGLILFEAVFFTNPLI